jgi:polar amino acid transport system substrate-binding protein
MLRCPPDASNSEGKHVTQMPGSGTVGEDCAAALAPGGTLRVGVVEAPKAGTFFVVRDPGSGRPRGVTVDLGAALAERLGVPVEYRVFANSGECTDATSVGEVDVAFMPVDEERRKKVAFGPSYYVLESTYLVSGPSGLTSLAEVDRAGVRVVAIANTTTIRAAARTLRHTAPAAARSVEEAVEIVRSGRADALALSRDSLRTLLAALPGSRLVEGGFQETGIAVAVAKDRPAALACAASFLEEAKAAGIVRRAFDRVGLQDEAVAPAGR